MLNLFQHLMEKFFCTSCIDLLNIVVLFNSDNSELTYNLRSLCSHLFCWHVLDFLRSPLYLLTNI